MNKIFNIHMTGVGGQGIGLLSQSLLTAIDLAGIKAVAVDTHGLAQRGGMVVSRIRCGEGVHSPLIMKGHAHLILALEVHEAMRALQSNLLHGKTTIGKIKTSEKKPRFSLCFLDVAWHPLGVRLGDAPEITPELVTALCDQNSVGHYLVKSETIQDPRMQNMALLGTLAGCNLVPNVSIIHYQKAIETLFHGDARNKNMELFDQYASTCLK